ncbi:tetratricopeptide repeat protein [Phormidium sp. FACHB-592]|uniref:Tetratricopeptide repeat protein n=1 Tax=Stenomitos frigidus AS-A4 TaxID=2933935 RepID=A0ABV0KM67_9CYAN|nr:tetratricopeptide repeat protein [Phormidium sp. FACHB-592]MBD2072458.1 tetratricopeptide repeat protein [Phormidium sp. FACHB-592]
MGASISVNQETFATEVIEKSHQKPVLVDFFAQWCGPCQMLKPLLEKLAQEYDFVLAKVDIDQSPDLAQTYGVGGVPDVKVAIDGTLTDGFIGMLPEPKLREFLAQLQITSLLDTALESIYADAAIGNVEQAEARLSRLLEQHPDNRGLTLEAANFYIEADRLDKAENLLATIQEYDKEHFPHTKTLRAIVQFKQIALQPKEGTNLDHAFRQAANLVLDENYAAALEQFLTIVTSDRRFRDDGARKAMLAIFDLLGDDHPLTKDYRKQLVMALY